MYFIKTFQQLSSTAKAIMLVTFFYALTWPVVSFIPLYLHHSLHYSLLQTGWTVSAFGLGFLLAAFWGAKICDHFPAYTVSILAKLGFLVVLLLFIWMHQSKMMVLVFLFLLGVTNSIFSPALRLFLMRCVPKEIQLQTNALRYALLNLGCALAYGLASFILHDHYNRYFWVAVTCSFLLIVSLLLFCKKDMVATRPTTLQGSSFWTTPQFRWFLLYSFVGILILAQLSTAAYGLFLTKSAHLNSQHLSLLFTENCLLIVALQMPLIARLKKLPQLPLMLVGACIMGIGFAFLLVGHSYWVAIVSQLILTLGEIAFMPTAQTLAYQMAPEGQSGHYMGLYQIFYALAFMVGPIMGTSALHFAPSGTLLWGGCIVLPLIVLFVYRLKCYCNATFK